MGHMLFRQLSKPWVSLDVRISLARELEGPRPRLLEVSRRSGCEAAQRGLDLQGLAAKRQRALPRSSVEYGQKSRPCSHVYECQFELLSLEYEQRRLGPEAVAAFDTITPTEW